MPIEIKELHIKINVDSENDHRKSSNQHSQRINKQEIIAHCVEQVIEIIDNKVER